MKEKILAWVKKWEGRGYSNGIPDEADLGIELAERAPSYRRICMAIMRNDVQLESLGYTRELCAAYIAIKRDELQRAGKSVRPLRTNQEQLSWL